MCTVEKERKKIEMNDGHDRANKKVQLITEEFVLAYGILRLKLNLIKTS